MEILPQGFQRMLLISEPEQTLKSPPESKKRRLIASTLAIDILSDLHLKPQRISRYHRTFCALFISHQLVEKLNQLVALVTVGTGQCRPWRRRRMQKM